MQSTPHLTNYEIFRALVHLASFITIWRDRLQQDGDTEKVCNYVCSCICGCKLDLTGRPNFFYVAQRRDRMCVLCGSYEFNYVFCILI